MSAERYRSRYAFNLVRRMKTATIASSVHLRNAPHTRRNMIQLVPETRAQKVQNQTGLLEAMKKQVLKQSGGRITIWTRMPFLNDWNVSINKNIGGHRSNVLIPFAPFQIHYTRYFASISWKALLSYSFLRKLSKAGKE